MEIAATEVLIPTADGQMPAALFTPLNSERKPAMLMLMEAFGLTSHIREVAARMTQQGYLVLVPDLYYRELPDNKFSYNEVEQAMAMMWRLDFGQAMENDLAAALAYLQAQPDVKPKCIGVVGFCLGGGLAFFAACKFSEQIAAVASFYGMVPDAWLDAANQISVPVYLFFGGRDPFISGERIQQIEARFQALHKGYQLKVYPDAGHGFFCNERSDYSLAAAADAWGRLTQFFDRHLQLKATETSVKAFNLKKPDS